MKKKLLLLAPALAVTALASCGEKTTYRVIFNPDFEGSSVSAVSVEKDKTVDAPTLPVRDGYTFSGWRVSPDDASDEFKFDTKITGDTVLYGSWTLGDPTEKELSMTDAIAYVKDHYTPGSVVHDKHIGTFNCSMKTNPNAATIYTSMGGKKNFISYLLGYLIDGDNSLEEKYKAEIVKKIEGEDTEQNNDFKINATFEDVNESDWYDSLSAPEYDHEEEGKSIYITKLEEVVKDHFENDAKIYLKDGLITIKGTYYVDLPHSVGGGTIYVTDTSFVYDEKGCQKYYNATFNENSQITYKNGGTSVVVLTGTGSLSVEYTN